MGLFDRIKKLFSGSGEKSELQKKSFAVSELDKFENWFDSEIKTLTNEKNNEMKDVCNDIKSGIEETKEKMNALSEAKLRNDKIPERAKQILAGNKDEYLRKVRQFLEHANPPKEIERETIRGYGENAKKSLEFLYKSTIKQSFVLKEFHEHEAHQVNLGIKQIQDNVIKLIEISESDDFRKIESVKNSIAELNKTLKAKKRIEEEISASEKEIEDSKHTIEKTEHELTKLLENQEFMEIQNLKQKKEKINSELKGVNTIVSDKFSNIRKALEKFKRGRTDEKLIEKYLENPMETLADDKRLGIVLVIDGLRKSIEKNQIELKDSIRQKTIQVCRETTKDELEEYALKYLELTAEIEKIDDRIKNSTIMRMKGDLDNKHDFLNERVSKLKSQMISLKSEMEKIDYSESEENIKDEVKELLNCEIAFKEK